MADVALVLLAAGMSSRMGSPKQLLPYLGKPLVRHAVEVALASECRPVVVVLGAKADAIRAVIQDLPIEIVENPRWSEGMGTSIASGVNALGSRPLDGLILALADQPLVTPDILNRLVATHHHTGLPIVTSEYAGTVGVPVFFCPDFFPRLVALEPSQGCKGVILAHAASAFRLECPEAEVDIDTPQDYRRIRKA